MMAMAPDGGPARRRPADTDLELAEQPAELADRHTQLATDVSELGGHLAEEQQKLHSQLASLGGTVTQLAQQIEDALGEQAANPASIDWWTLDRAEAEKAWSGLWQWLEEFYLPVAHPLARPRVHQHQGPGQTIRLRSRTPPRHPRRETSRQSTSPPPHTSGGPRASKST